MFYGYFLSTNKLPPDNSWTGFIQRAFRPLYTQWNFYVINGHFMYSINGSHYMTYCLQNYIDGLKLYVLLTVYSDCEEVHNSYRQVQNPGNKSQRPSAVLRGDLN